MAWPPKRSRMSSHEAMHGVQVEALHTAAAALALAVLIH